MPQYRGIIIFFTAVTAVFILIQVWHARVAPEEEKKERERKLEGIAFIMGLGTPKMVDDTSRLNSVTYKDGTMRVSYTLTQLAMGDIDVADFTTRAKAVAVEQSCAREGLGLFVKSGLVLVYIFKESSNSLIVNVQVSKSDCIQ
ncbi:hypothetical protein QWI18_02110 [Pseudomonas sp. W2Oct36]|uniref:hypothetical protein n=1 Tax=Pseudomonas sp. W2Oct36 TaxID=1215284 RepID=UPI0034E05BD9